MTLSPRFLVCAISSLLFAFMQGCCTYYGPQLHLQVEAVAGMNDDTPVTVELVFFYDTDLLAEARAWKARDWFGEPGLRFRSAQSEGRRSFEVSHWEWVPGQEATPPAFWLRPGTKGAIFFADYPTLGDHRALIEDPNGTFRLYLLGTGFRVEALGPIAD